MTHAPTLTEHQICRIRSVSKLRQVNAGEILYQPNDETPAVYIVISGGVRVSFFSAGQAHTFMTYLPGQFSGDLLMICGRRSIYRCDGTLLELKAKDLRTLIGKDAEFSDLHERISREKSFVEGSGKGQCRRSGFEILPRDTEYPRVSDT